MCAEDGFARRTVMAANDCSDEWETDDNLTKLYDLSLLNHTKTGEYRFVLHTLVRIHAKNLAIESNVYAIAQERHANFFVERLQSDDLENAAIVAEVAADLEDMLLAAEWVRNQQGESAQGRKKRYKFAAKLQPLFEKYGHWQKAITLMARFQTWAEQFQDWSTLARFKLQEARYWSYTGKFERAIEVLQSARTSLHNIESLDMRREREVKLLNVLAGIFQKQGRSEEAIQTFRDEILIEEEIGDSRALAIAYNRLGGLLQQQGKLEEAQQAFERRIAISEMLNDQASLAIGLNCLGGLFQQQEKLEEALKIARHCVAVEEELGDSKGLTMALMQLSQILKALEKVPEAIITLENIVEIETKLGNQRGVVMTLSSLASLQKDHQYFDKAFNTLLRLLAIEEKLNNRKRTADVLCDLGYVTLQQEKFEQSSEYYDRSIELSKENSDEEVADSILNRIAVSLHHYGIDLLEKRKNTDKAVEVLERSQEIFQQLNNFYSVAWVLHSLGRAWKIKGELLKSELCLKRSQEIFENENDIPSLAKVLNTLGGVLEKLQKWNEAEKILRRCYDLALDLQDLRGQSVISNSMGQVMARQEDDAKFKLAQMYFGESIKLGVQLDDKHHLAKVYTAMGQALLIRKDFEKATEKLIQGFEIDESLSNKRGLKIVTPNLTYALVQLKKHDDALAYCQRSLKIAPNDRNLLQLRSKLETTISGTVQKSFVKTGTILYIRQNEDKSHWGQIKPNDGSFNIHFNEKFINSECITKLTQGNSVEVEFKEKDGKFYAKNSHL